MENTLQRFVEDAARATDCAELGLSFENAIQSLGFDHYIYLQLPTPEVTTEAVYLTNYPAHWIQRYIEQDYVAIDPVLKASLQSRVPFDWQNHWFKEQRKQQGAFFDEAAEVGVRTGFSIPFHQNDKPAGALSIASELEETELNKLIGAHTSTLNLLRVYFYVHADRLLRNGQDEGFHLTPREAECLRWQALGKTMWEISKILSISERTVQFHMDNAKTKLGANTVPHAVAIAIKSKAIAF